MYSVVQLCTRKHGRVRGLPDGTEAFIALTVFISSSSLFLQRVLS